MKKIRFIIAVILFLAFSVPGKAQDATKLYNEGVQLKNEKKISEAFQKFKSAIALKPDYVEAIYESGWCQNDLKQYDGAVKSLRKALNYWTSVPKVYFELGYAHEKLGNIDSALENYNRCLKYKSDYSLVYRRFGEIAYQKDDYAKTLENFSKYESYAKAPITDYLYWYRKGFSNNALKNYSEAKTALLKAQGFKDDYINTYLELGFACNKMKQADEAIDWFKKAMAIDPKSHIPYNGIAEVYRDTKKDMAEAMTWYNKALDVKPGERKAHFGIGYCLNSQGKYSEAITHLKKAIDSEPTYTAAYVELGYSQYMTGSNDEALRNLDKALSLSPKNENARYYSGLVYIARKDKAKAQKMVDELRGLSSTKNADALQAKVNAL